LPLVAQGTGFWGFAATAAPEVLLLLGFCCSCCFWIFAAPGVFAATAAPGVLLLLPLLGVLLLLLLLGFFCSWGFAATAAPEGRCCWGSAAAAGAVVAFNMMRVCSVDEAP
jgi:hypothetical protein